MILLHLAFEILDILMQLLYLLSDVEGDRLHHSNVLKLMFLIGDACEHADDLGHFLVMNVFGEE